MPLKDHQPFTPALLKKISTQAEKSGAKGLITTEKDLTKLQQDNFSLPCFALKMEVETDHTFDSFMQEKMSIFTQLCQSSHKQT